jgi:hypothetical protein
MREAYEPMIVSTASSLVILPSAKAIIKDFVASVTSRPSMRADEDAWRIRLSTLCLRTSSWRLLEVMVSPSDGSTIAFLKTNCYLGDENIPSDWNRNLAL